LSFVLPLKAVPVSVYVKISPLVSTVLTVIVKSLVTLTPPKSAPSIVITSFGS